MVGSTTCSDKNILSGKLGYLNLEQHSELTRVYGIFSKIKRECHGCRLIIRYRWNIMLGIEMNTYLYILIVNGCKMRIHKWLVKKLANYKIFAHCKFSKNGVWKTRL